MADLPDYMGKTSVGTMPVESVEFIRVTETETVEVGGIEIVTIRAPEGYLYDILNLYIGTAPPGGAGAGSHSVRVRSEDEFLYLLYGRSSDNQGIYFTRGEWYTADIEQRPADATAQAIVYKNMRIDEDSGIQFIYNNYGEVDQEGFRLYMLWVRKIKVISG